MRRAEHLRQGVSGQSVLQSGVKALATDKNAR